jgi:serine/threonine protein kinase
MRQNETSRRLSGGEPLLPGLLAWDRLGAGEHCETWLAWSTDLWSPVAVKLPRPGETDSADTRQDLVLEAWARSQVDHPGFQRLWRSGVQERVPHLVLEYVEGPSLTSLLADRRLTPADVVLIGLQIASSLRYLHGRGLVHLDVKPSNVVVREGRAVLIDLGITTPAGQRFEEDDAPGTVPFMAPELFDGGVVTGAVDVFALGATLYEALAGVPAFPDPEDDAPGLVGADRPDPRPLVDTAPMVGGELADLVERMLARRPADRPDDDAVLSGLAAALPEGDPGLWPSWATGSLGSTGARRSRTA